MSNNLPSLPSLQRNAVPGVRREVAAVQHAGDDAAAPVPGARHAGALRRAGPAERGLPDRHGLPPQAGRAQGHAHLQELPDGHQRARRAPRRQGCDVLYLVLKVTLLLQGFPSVRGPGLAFLGF